MTANLQDPRFTSETAAREALEAVVWPSGPICPHCGNADPDKIAKLTTKSARPGLRYCNECKKQFTATVGTVFERSKIPLTKWWLAMHLIGSSKKGMSSHQLHRMLGVSYKSTWFMMHRIREAMKPDDSHQETGGFGGARRTLKRIMLALDCYSLFMGTFWHLNPPELRAQLLNKLSNEPLIRQSLDRRTAIQGSIPEAPPPALPPEPSG